MGSKWCRKCSYHPVVVVDDDERASGGDNTDRACDVVWKKLARDRGGVERFTSRLAIVGRCEGNALSDGENALSRGVAAPTLTPPLIAEASILSRRYKELHFRPASSKPNFSCARSHRPHASPAAAAIPKTQEGRTDERAHEAVLHTPLRLIVEFVYPTPSN